MPAVPKFADFVDPFVILASSSAAVSARCICHPRKLIQPCLAEQGGRAGQGKAFFSKKHWANHPAGHAQARPPWC